MVMFGSMLPPRVMSGSMVLLQSGYVLMFVACVVTEGYVDVCALCFRLNLCCYLWAVLLLSAMSMCMT